jgi:hypothetical protein
MLAKNNMMTLNNMFLKKSTESRPTQIYIGLILFALCLFLLTVETNFSFMWTLSAMLSFGSFAVIIWDMESSRTAHGVATQMFELYVLTYLARAWVLTATVAYRPMCASGDFWYPLFEILCLFGAAYTLYLCKVKYADTADVRDQPVLSLPSIASRP